MTRIKSFKHFIFLMSVLLAVSSIGINAAPIGGEEKNIAPTIDLSITPVKKPVDIVILTDYTGIKLAALDNRINALKAQFSAVNVDPVFHIVSSIKKVGTQNDKLYSALRKAYYNYQINYAKVYTPGTSWNYYYDQWHTEEVTWETTQVLASQFGNLPKRNPQNITFTRSALQNKYRSNGELWERNYFVTINCTNDIKPKSEVITVTKEYYSDYSEHYYDYIKSENATIDTTWTIEGSGTDVGYDVYSLDFDKLNAITLRAGSDRHMIFLSDAYAKDYSKELGNYFSFGDMTDTLKSYINTNKFSLYGVMPEDARDRTLLPDKVSEVLPLGNTTLFNMNNGKTLKPSTDFGVTTYSELTENIGDIKEVLKTSSMVYLHMEDGTIKYYDSTEDKFKTVAGITNAVKVYSFDAYAYFYILDSNGKIFYMDSSRNVEAFNNSIAISNIFRVSGGENIYVTATGVPYMEYRTWNKSTGVTADHLLTRAKIKDSAGAVRYLPNIKDAAAFTARAPESYLNRSPTLVLYNTGQIHQFTSVYEDITTVGNIWTYISYLKEDTSISVLESNVESIETNEVCIFIYKTDGTIKMLNAEYKEGTYYNDDDKKRTGMLPSLRNTTLSVPLANIEKTFRTGMERYLFIDSSGKVYMYNGTYQANAPVVGTTLIYIGNNIKKIIGGLNKSTSSSTRSYLFFLLNDGTVKQIGFFKNRTGLENYTTYNPSLLSCTDIKDIYTSCTDAYFLKNDGYVLSRSNTINSQLTDVFSNPLTVDTTKTYLSLLDIFNQALSGVFYPTGAYTAALNDIYNKYSYSGSNSMYVLLGDEIKYESAYDDYEKDPEHSRKWQISHDPYYFDNSMGVSVYHNPAGFTVNPPAKLDKSGKYVINLKARDNPKADNRFDNYRLWSLGEQNMTVYIHRKPIALQRITVTNNGNGTFTVKAFDAGSYDPDHSITRSDKGITAREWRWRESTSTTWIAGQMNKTDCSPEKSYITQLRVKDAEGVWSDYTTITIDENNPPVALFNIDNTVINISEYLKVKDQSYPQSFSSITDWHWVVKKLNSDGSAPGTNIHNAKFTNSNAGTGTMAGYDINVRTNYNSNGTGKYRAYLRVKDSNGLWSDGGTDSATPADLTKYYSRDFEVDRPPAASFTADKNIIKPDETLKLRDTSTASGTSALAKWHWTVKKLNADGSVPGTNIQNGMFDNRNSGTGGMTGYDINVKTLYSDTGTGTYRIYLRVMNGNKMWSDGGTDSTFNPGSCFTRDIIVDTPPVAQFTIAKNPVYLTELLKIRDTSYKTGVSNINRWHWIVKKLNGNGSVPTVDLQNAQYNSSNNGSEVLAGYDANVKTDYNSNGTGTYRVYLRTRNGSNMWSDGGTDSSINLGGFFYRDIIVEEDFKVANFRVVKVKDLHLESYYYNTVTGQYDDRPMGVNTMAIDRQNFGGIVDGLTRGYLFEFEIDTVNFNESNDTIIITPHFYTCDSYRRDPEERDLYWENSCHEILKAGEGGHAAWADIRLGREDRIIKGDNRATWRGSYLIPGTAWAVPRGTSAANAGASRIKRDIIVGFEIKGYKGGVMRYDYNLRQWPLERTVVKQPYELGDVIRYSYTKCNLDDNNVILNRP